MEQVAGAVWVSDIQCGSRRGIAFRAMLGAAQGSGGGVAVRADSGAVREKLAEDE